MSTVNNAGFHGPAQNNIVENKPSEEVMGLKTFWEALPKGDETQRDVLSDIFRQTYSDETVLGFLSEAPIRPDNRLFSNLSLDKEISEPTDLRKEFERLRPDAAKKFFSIDQVNEEKTSPEVQELKTFWEALPKDGDTARDVLLDIFRETYSDETVLSFLSEAPIQPDDRLFSNLSVDKEISEPTDLRKEFERLRPDAAKKFFSIDQVNEEKKISPAVQELKEFWEHLPKNGGTAKGVLLDIFRENYSDEIVLDFLLEVGIRPNGGFFLRKNNQPTNLRTQFEQLRPRIAKIFFSSNIASSVPEIQKNSPHTLTFLDLPQDFKMQLGQLFGTNDLKSLSETSKALRNDFLTTFQKKSLYDFAISMALRLDDTQKVIYLNNTINAQIRDGDIYAAKETASLMDLKDAEQSNSLIAIAQAKQHDLHGAEETASLIINNLAYKVDALLEITKAKSTIGDQEGVKEVLALLKNLILSAEEKELPRVANLRKVAQAQANFDSVTRANITLNLIEEIISSQDEGHRYRYVSLRRIAHDFIKIGKKQEAARILSLAEESALELDHDDNKRDALKEIAILQIQNGEKDEAEKTKQKALSFETDGFQRHLIFKEIIKAQIECSDTYGAQKTLLEARDNSSSVDNVKPFGNDGGGYARNTALEEIAQQQIEIGDITEARKTIDLIENPLNKSNTLQKIALAQFKKNEKEQTIKTLEEAKDAALKIDSMDIQYETLIQIAQHYGTINDVPRAKEILASLIEKVPSMTKEKRCPVLLRIAKAYAEIGNMEEVKHLFSAIQKETLSNESLVQHTVYGPLENLAKFQIELKDIEEAKKTVHLLKDIAPKIPNEDHQTSLLRTIAKLQIQVGDTEGAKKTLIQAKPKVISLHRVSYLVSDLTAIAHIQAEMGNTEEAKNTLRDAKAIAFLGRYDSITLGGLTAIAKAQTAIGDMQGAQETLINLKEKEAFSRAAEMALNMIEALNKAKIS